MLSTRAAALLLAAVAVPLCARGDPASDKAEATLKAMTPAEKTVLTIGVMPLRLGPDAPPPPPEALPGAGYVHGIPRLGVPALLETDASLGVSYVSGQRKDWATPLPSGLAQASTWNPDLVRRGGAMIGSEARAKGFNVLLAGGANLMRDPRNGRTFEYLSEDPLLTGVLVGNAIAGIQSNHIVSTIKHFALNGQETARKVADVKISDAAARESDLLAFQIGIEIGDPGSVMCAYNRIQGHQACASDYLLNEVLKKDWGYKGFVMSDWGAVPSLDSALEGLDQQSGSQLDPAVFFGEKLGQAATEDKRYAGRLDDMNRRILWAIYDNGLDTHPVSRGNAIDFAGNGEVALEVARQGIVLLKNEGNALPLAAGAQRIAVIGGYADTGVMSGGGSSQVHAEGGPALVLPLGGEGRYAGFLSEQFHRSPPLAAIRKLAPQAQVTYRNSNYLAEAVAKAKAADVAIVFATKWAGEGMDLPDLSLPNGQDALIAAVAEANPNTIVVLETGNPVAMPWLGKVPAVIEAWYPGGRGGEAIAEVLFGMVNPSGKLPITFPRTTADLPREKVDGFDRLEPDFGGSPAGAEGLTVDYDIEGSDVGYRWNAREGKTALFPFGHGLSYTKFTADGLQTDGRTAKLTLQNTGPRAGATVAQLYLVERGGERLQRLVGFERVELAPGESKTVTLAIDPRLLAEWDDGGWSIAPGAYRFALGDDAETLGEPVSVSLKARRWK